MSAPIPLTSDQIETVLSAVPDVPGTGRFAKQIARNHLQERIRAVLEEIKLVPVEAAFNEFKDEIIRSIYESFIEQYKPVGVAAGVALGGPVTQLSLNSFHMAGAQSGVALAFQKIRDFLTGSKMNRNPQTKIFFKQVTQEYPSSDLHDTLHRGTFDFITSLRPSFEQNVVQDLILDDGVHILTYEEAAAVGVPRMVDLHASIRPQRFTDKATRFPLTHVVELRLNTYRMYTHQITMGMIASAIEGPEPADSLTVVWKSQIDGRAYIIVDETRNYGLESMAQQTAILMYLHRDVIKKFGQWKVSGITDITLITPQEIDVTNGIYQIKGSKSNPLHHYVFTTNFRTRWEGISLADIHNLFKTAGFQVLSMNKADLNIVVEYDPATPQRNLQLQRAIELAQATSPEKRSPLQKAGLKKEISLIDAIKLIVETIRDKVKKKELLSPEEEELAQAASYWFALANGANMDELSWRQDLDLFRLASSHPHEIFEILGIDAAMVFFTLRFRQTLSDFSAYINPRHISLTFALLCNLGIINSLSFAGINRRRIGPLAMASYERSMNVFMNSATFGDKEAVVGVSPSIYVGQKSKKVGTGAVQIEQDLTVIPKDTPTLPTLDEESILDGLSLPPEATGFAELRLPPMLPEPALAPVNKREITRTSVISSTPHPVDESLLPPTTQLVAPSEVLQSALRKVTTGTGVTFAPDQPPQLELPPEITTLEDIGGLTLLPAQRARPAPPPPSERVTAQLKSVATPNIPQLAPPPTVSRPAPPVVSFTPEPSPISFTGSEKGSVAKIAPSALLRMIPKH